mgnify:CR=1 FL=1
MKKFVPILSLLIMSSPIFAKAADRIYTCAQELRDGTTGIRVNIILSDSGQLKATLFSVKKSFAMWQK